jgi:Protein of unknown function (DUF2612)
MSEFALYFLPGPPTFPPATPGVPGLVYQPDHPGDAESKLLEQFSNAVKLHALVRALVKPLQALELAALSVRDAFDVDNAEGAQLDVVGWLVGEDRLGKGDVAYRAYVKARILANASKGRPREIYALARALLGESPTLLLSRESGLPAHYNFDIADTTLRFPWDTDAEVAPDVVARALRDAFELATVGGVSFLITYQFSPYAFECASGDVEEDDVLRGFADDDDEEADGGSFVGAEGNA